MTTTTMTPPLAARGGFAQLLLAEWTKFRSVRATAWGLLAMIFVTIGMSVFGASAGGTSTTCPCRVDQFHFVHRTLQGDGDIVARVVTQQNTGEWARAGLMVKADTEPGSPYAAIMVTPGHGVRLQSNFTTDIAGSAARTPRWLKLSRAGTTVTAFESADGTTWSRVGAVTVQSLPSTVEIGLFVTSPPQEQVTRRGANTTVRGVFTPSTATFDSVAVQPAGAAQPADWSDLDVGGPAQNEPGGPPIAGSAAENAGTFTVTGVGDITEQQPTGDDDVVVRSLFGVIVGLMAIAVVGVVFFTSEFSKGLIRTTFAVSPRRGRVLAAKAIVVGVGAFTAGLVATTAGFGITQPILHRNGYRPRAYPYLSFTDGPVLQAVVGGAALLAAIGLLSLAAGAILRRAAAAIAISIGLVIVPSIIAEFLPTDVGNLVERLTPAAGLVVLQTRDRVDGGIGPWAGLGVACAYAVAALVVAHVLLRRRDA